jgi:hypothetical protein
MYSIVIGCERTALIQLIHDIVHWQSRRFGLYIKSLSLPESWAAIRTPYHTVVLHFRC